MLGRSRPTFPQFLSRRPFDFKRFKRVAERVQPALRAIENLSRPRWTPPHAATACLVGAVCSCWRCRPSARREKVGGAEHIVVGDLSSIAETNSVADQVNRLGGFDAVIHNAGIGYREPKLVKTVDGLPQLFAVNTLAPYLLTALIITMPKRLVYLSSGMHYGAGSHLDDMLWEKRRWNGSQAYAETKFHDVLLSFAVARLFPEVNGRWRRSFRLSPRKVRCSLIATNFPFAAK